MENLEENKKLESVICLASEDGISRILPVAKRFKERGSRVIVILGGKLEQLESVERMISRVADELFLAATNDSFGSGVGVVEVLKELFDVIERSTHTHYPELVYAIVPKDSGRKIIELTKSCSVKTVIEPVSG